MLHSASATEYFPLTLTLSLPPSRRAKAPLRRDGGREREQRASDGCLAKNCLPNSGTVVIERRLTVFPLPRGEGRGEGEHNVANPTISFVMPQGRGSVSVFASRRRMYRMKNLCPFR